MEWEPFHMQVTWPMIINPMKQPGNVWTDEDTFEAWWHKMESDSLTPHCWGRVGNIMPQKTFYHFLFQKTALTCPQRRNPKNTWRWMAGPSAKTRTRGWTSPSPSDPSCCRPSRCPWASSWTSTARGSCDCWAGSWLSTFIWVPVMTPDLLPAELIHVSPCVFPAPASPCPACWSLMEPAIPTVSPLTFSHTSSQGPWNKPLPFVDQRWCTAHVCTQGF